MSNQNQSNNVSNLSEYLLKLPIIGKTKGLYEDDRKIKQEYLEELVEWCEEFLSVQFTTEEAEALLKAAIAIQDGYKDEYFDE